MFLSFKELCRVAQRDGHIVRDKLKGNIGEQQLFNSRNNSYLKILILDKFKYKSLSDYNLSCASLEFSPFFLFHHENICWIKNYGLEMVLLCPI